MYLKDQDFKGYNVQKVKKSNLTHREGREQDKINQTYAQLTGAKVREAQANKDRSSAITGAISGVASGCR